MRLLHVVGARPNFPKLAPVHRAGAAAHVEQLVVHTGQHYDELMSSSFFSSLGIPEPDVNLAVGSGSHAQQTARIMERIEPVFEAKRPDWVVVYGDVNSTVAAALVAAKLGLRIAHVEAGLRSWDRAMPEEINRIVTDRLADLLLTPSRDADDRLRQEREPEEEIVFVGNVMVDTLFYSLARLGLERDPDTGWRSDGSVVVTLHRPSNVDDVERLRATMTALEQVATARRVIFPVHPRTKTRLDTAGIVARRVEMIDPVSYDEMLTMMTRAHALVTDSGGLQEETTSLGIPCLTLRENTERPITIIEGTNRLIPDPADLPDAVASVVRVTTPPRPEGWDGCAGIRVIEALHDRLAAMAIPRRPVDAFPQSAAS